MSVKKPMQKAVDQAWKRPLVECGWKQRGIQVFHRTGPWATRHTDERVFYLCTACDPPRTIASYSRSEHALGRASKGKAAVRVHVEREHAPPTEPRPEAAITCDKCGKGHGDRLTKPCGVHGCECWCNR